MRGALLLVLSGCADPATGPAGSADTSAETVGEPEAVVVPLEAPRLLRRLSLDLRGTLPTVEELNAVEADPAAVWGYRDAWLTDPRLEERLVYLLGEQWHTRVDEFLIFSLEYQALAGNPESEYPFERAVGEEPLRLMARVVAEDRPWSDVVTADWTMAPPLLAEIWPLAQDAPGEGWRVAHYTDGRPAAGVLATNGLWWRYFSTQTNYNRGRVAALTRLLVCEDYAARSISLTEAAALGEGSALETALRDSPYCQGCHASIDPIAATLFGFWPANEYSIHEVDVYHPDREPLGALLMDVTPAWFGDPVYGLNELGAHIAADPRFARCAAQTFAAALWRREVDAVEDFDQIEALRQVLAAADLRIQPLLAAITETPTYQAGALAETATEADAAREATVRLLSPDQLASALEDLSGGFRWTRDGFDQLDNDTYGFRVLAGGVDGAYVTRPQDAPSMTQALVVQRLAEAAAAQIAAETYGTQPVSTALLEALHWRLYATHAEADWLDAAEALWAAVDAAEGPTVAWQALLSGALRDARFVGY